jgi:signal transduction histidine kinase
VQDYLSAAGIRCRLLLPDELPDQYLSTIQRRNLFLAVKEALHNAVKHARASVVTMRLHLCGNDLVLEIEDDGCGLPPDGSAETAQPGAAGCDGLANMEKRLAALGGHCEQSSTATGGTTIRLIAPLQLGKAR